VKYRLLTALPLVAALALIVALSSVADPGQLYRVEVLGLKALAAIGAGAAAFRFLRRDYLRAAWLLTALCYTLLFTKDLVFGLGWRAMDPFPETVAWLRGGLTLAANLAGVIGTFLLARAWQVAGILLPGSARARWVIFAAGVLLALATAGHATVIDTRELLGGNPQRLVSVASDLGDIFSLVLIAPVLLTAIALRGGLLAWPWALMTASQLGWLLYDAVATLNVISPMAPPKLRALEEIFRCLACLFAFASGVSQRLVMSDMRAAGAARGHVPRSAARG
jgi:hypothetical protein